MSITPFSPAKQILADLRARETTAAEVVALYRERRERLEQRVNAIVTPNYDSALDRARGIDAARGTPASTLAGLPTTVMDGIHVAGRPASGGMIEPDLAIADEDAPNVSRLKTSGAVILGKTNTPIANADWQAVNKLFGRTTNPWNPQLTAGGSTGGGAAAVATGLTGAELGSDIGGSIRIPAAFCGVFGHKPSATVLPNSGHFPWRGNFPNPAVRPAVQGPLTRSAADLELLFGVMAGPDGLEGKGWRLELPGPRFESLATCRVGILKLPAWIPVEQAILDAQQSLVDTLASLGAQVREVDLTEAFGDLTTYYKHFLMQLQCVLGGATPPHARAKAAAKMRTYDDPFLAAVADGLEGSAALMLEMLEASERCKAKWEVVFRDIDVLLSPVCSVNAFPHDDSFFYDRTLLIDGARHPYYRLSAIPALASLPGLPATVFPTGRRSASGAPIGLQVMGAYLEDRTTLEFAQLVERETGGFVPPPGFD
ncbi:MAG: amidase [Gammaproteobacteria bacterium]|nr:amidase [Gammaproteobacteria bacterium]